MKRTILVAACVTLASCGHERSPPADQMIDVGSHRLLIHREGRGSPTVVIDAGIGDQLDKLRPLQERLARVTQVITYNRAGYGQSEPGPLPRDAEREAELFGERARMADAVRSFGDRPLIVVGAGKPNPTFGEVAEEYQPYWIAQSRALADKSTRGTFTLAGQSSHYLYVDVPDLVEERILSLVHEVRREEG